MPSLGHRVANDQSVGWVVCGEGGFPIPVCRPATRKGRKERTLCDREGTGTPSARYGGRGVGLWLVSQLRQGSRRWGFGRGCCVGVCGRRGERFFCVCPFSTGSFSKSFPFTRFSMVSRLCRGVLSWSANTFLWRLLSMIWKRMRTSLTRRLASRYSMAENATFIEL